MHLLTLTINKSKFMKYLKDIKNKIKWEKYYNPDFDWHYRQIYIDNTLSEDFIKAFKNKVAWYNIARFQILSEDFIR